MPTVTKLEGLGREVDSLAFAFGNRFIVVEPGLTLLLFDFLFVCLQLVNCAEHKDKENNHPRRPL